VGRTTPSAASADAMWEVCHDPMRLGRPILADLQQSPAHLRKQFRSL